MRVHQLVPLLCSLLGAVVAPSPALAQLDRSSLAGTVTDSTSGLLAGATVSVSSTATGDTRSAVTSASGVFRVVGLVPGTYAVEVAFDGFNNKRVSDVRLRAGETRTLDVTLDIAGQETTVLVVQQAPVADRSSAQQGAVISETELAKVPVNGRDWSSFMALAPGAVDSGGGGQRGIRFMGKSKDDNNYMFDGIDATGVKEGPHLTALRTVISNDAIAEFRVAAGAFTAEYGNSIAGVVSLVSKSGTNSFRGGSFLYHRDDSLDSKRFIDTVKPAFDMNQFGANLGGPVARNRTFFFANYEGLRQSQERTFIGFVPSPGFRQRAIAASPSLRPVVEAFPAGQETTANADIERYTAQFDATQNENSFMARLDHRFTGNTAAYVRYNIADGTIATPGSMFGDVTDANLRAQNLVVQLQHTSNALLNELKVGWNKSGNDRVRSAPLLESVSIPGFTTVPGETVGADPGQSFSFVDNVTLIRGRHTFKSGVEIRRNQIDISQGDSFTLAFASRDAFIANRMDQALFSGAFEPRIVRTDTYAGYVQDEWKITSTMTINAGVRYEYYTPLHERDGRQRIYDRIECGGICPAGSETYFPDRNNFGPRLSWTWTPARLNGKTTFRLGGGVYHQQGQLDDLLGPIESDNVRVQLTPLDVPALSYPAQRFFGQGTASFDTPRALQRRRRDFESYQLGAFIMQELPWGLSGQIGYLGNRGRNILQRFFDNAIDPATGQRPLPNFGLVDIKYDGSRTMFDGLQASLQRRYQAGLLVNAQYQLGYAKDNGAVGSNEAAYPQDLACRDCEWAYGNFDVRHQFTLNWVYELPFGRGPVLGGWELSGQFTARTGMPLNVVVTRPATAVPDGYTAAFGTTTQRPNLVPGVNPIPDRQTASNWLNIAAFSVPANGTRGNLGRNAFRQPGFNQLDAALSKRIDLRGSTALTFRIEGFNLLNRSQLGRPNANISSPADFGRITTVLNPNATGSGTARQVQFMMRVGF